MSWPVFYELSNQGFLSRLRTMWGKKRTPPPPEWVCRHCGGARSGLLTDHGGRLPENATSPAHIANRGG